VDNTGFITQAQLEALITSVYSQMDPDNPEKFASIGVLHLFIPHLSILLTFSQRQQGKELAHHQSSIAVVGTDPLGVRVVSVGTFVSQVFAHLRITNGRLSLEQFRQAIIAEPRLLLSCDGGNRWE
jgi:hypothetical protein